MALVVGALPGSFALCASNQARSSSSSGRLRAVSGAPRPFFP